MKHNYLKIWSVLLLSIIGLAACDNTEDSPITPKETINLFISNEGLWGNGDASLSVYTPGDTTLKNDAFKNSTKTNLGDQAQSVSVINGNAYIAVQNSQKIEVLNAKTLEYVTTIEDVNPRYILQVSSEKAYISDWGTNNITGQVKVLDLTSNTITKTIATNDVGANEMYQEGNLVYVTHEGGYDNTTYTSLFGSTIAVLDITTDKVVKTIQTPFNPSSITGNSEGIFVACNGKTVYNTTDWSIDETASTKGEIIKLDIAENSYKSIQKMNSFGQFASNLVLKDNKLLFILSGNIYEHTLGSAFPTSPIISNGFFKYFTVNPIEGEAGIIATVAPNYTSAGEVIFYNAKNEKVRSFTAGIAPNCIAY